MMNILLDTHIALWALTSFEKIDAAGQKSLEDESNTVYYSMASVWEVAIKNKIHPEQIPMSEEEFVALCNETGFSLLDIKVPHIFALKELKRAADAPRHNDPFDRLLIAQAKMENLKFMTHDSLLDGYNEDCVWKI